MKGGYSIIFKEEYFIKVEQNELFKDWMKGGGFEDATLSDFDFITFSSLFNKGIKNEELQKEYIRSFLESAKTLSNNSKEKLPIVINKIFFKYSLTLPIIYLCRHAIELEIKYMIDKLGGTPKPVHKLENLWTSLLNLFPKEKDKEESKIINAMTSFINYISVLDNDGTKLMYPSDKMGNLNQEIPIFVNTKLIVYATDKFIQQLNTINFSLIKSSNK